MYEQCLMYNFLISDLKTVCWLSILPVIQLKFHIGMQYKGVTQR